MIKELSKSIEKKPVEWVAMGLGVIAVAVVARKLTESPTRREQLLGELQSGLGRVRQTGSEIWHEGLDSAQNLQKEAGAMKASIAPSSSSRQSSGLLDKVSNHEGAIAAFMGTVLAKGVSSYFQWRSTEQAREQSRKNAAANNKSSEQSLDDMTVVELRREAAEQEIEGRSSMNKDDLVDALKG